LIKKLTFEEHEKLGGTLSVTRNNLIPIHAMLINNFGVKDPMIIQVANAVDCLDAVRSRLDDIFSEDFPELATPYYLGM
jgi:hypothetical protein